MGVHWVFSVVLAVLPFVCPGGVMLWMVDDTATVDGTPIYTFLDPYPSDDDHWNAVRVRASDGSTVRYLGVYAGEGETWPGEDGVELWDNGSGRWGSGLTQSPLFPDMLAECLYAVELGRISYDAQMDAVTWAVLAATDTYDRSALERYIYPEFTLNPPTQGIWTPTVFRTVPEPSSGALALLGLVLLALRRRGGVA